METPTPATPAGRNRSSSVPTDTDCSSVFDTNSPTSTSISPRSDAGHKLVATEETTSQDQLAPAVCSDDAGESTTIMFPSVFYGSANLQPPSRDRRAPAIFAGFISNIPPLSDEELRHVELSPASKNELTPAPTDDEEETTASQPKSSKSKKPASSSSSSTKSTPKPKAKITKKPLTKRTTKKTSRPTALTPVTSFENAQPSPPASQLGKRKLAATALGITPSKKPKQTPSTSELSDEKQQLRDIVERLLANRHPGAVKFAPAGQPAVWAEGRQELCETLHYFRSYQSACHSTGGFVRGFMFDNNAHVRDYIDNDVVISRAGGGMVKDKDSGEMKAGRDQSDDSSTVKALRNCMKQYNPVVVIVGTDNPHVPSKPPHQYCVLDYFKPTHIWVEKSGKGKILRYRFEKLNSKKESWWRPENEEESVELGSLGLPVEKTCDACTEKSPQIYLNGWMCLKPNCTTFWHILDESVPYEPNEASLMYDPRFLKQKTPWPNDDSEYPLAFNSAELSGYSIPGEDTSQAFWSGMVCPQCGRCNSRLSWTGWHCECGYRRDPPHALIPAASLRDPLWPLTSSYTMSKDILAPLIDVNVSFAHGYRINRYTIPGIEGFITHMIANQAILEEPGGPDDMFEELQQTDIGLERRSMPSGQLKGDKYCRHFAVNYGMPYKFIAATASHSFDGAARPVTATRSRLNWAAQLLMSQETGTSMDEVRTTWKEKEFNEVLALGYFESQKMNYHDDGEYGLGPTIATLSLGAPGTMRIRMKARNYNGSSTAGVYDDSRPIPGCTQFEARAELHASLQSLKASNPSAFRARLKQVPKDLKLKGSGNSKEVLKMELGHGDVVVMHGAEIQKYYEHAVEHAGKLRFALTCRYIDGGSLKEGDRPGYVVGADEGGYDGARVC
ncbi:hypothetical protein CC86DRAFT_448052 [Ophiobolus disseminans]|uniref:Alpha-ketoglutarate-dependent dioxygenase AlkB-like domain-containing protein n=1 Tax=Ophiobolus disseminans TaxID=1469910 RepID=A0A6A6ZPB3_9PLEO|nr:hypothetical protein CC86DRAFT_448052 [Ophiobolus disseminans]